jgi:hypothetical protein
MNVDEEISVTEMGDGAPILEGGSAPHCSECGQLMLPAAIENQSGSGIRLRCFVRQSGSHCYIAECIDLDISAESETLEGAVSGLNDAIYGYLLVVLDGVDTDQEAPTAVLRSSPLSHRIRYYWGYLKYKIGAAVSLRHRSSPKKFYRAPHGLGNSQCHV